jgi:hypothetical protein
MHHLLDTTALARCQDSRARGSTRRTRRFTAQPLRLLPCLLFGLAFSAGGSLSAGCSEPQATVTPGAAATLAGASGIDAPRPPGSGGTAGAAGSGGNPGLGGSAPIAGTGGVGGGASPAQPTGEIATQRGGVASRKLAAALFTQQPSP